MSQLKLYSFPLSGNAYKIRLMLSLLGEDHEQIDVDLPGGEASSPEFLRINPRGQVPVLVDGDEAIWDSMAILVYLARRYGKGQWLPDDAMAEAQVMQWLALSENELLYGLARARATIIFKRPFNLEQCQSEGKVGLAVLEQRLKDHDWLASDAPSIADIACYPYVLLAPVGEVSLDDYPAVRAWIARVEELPGWQPMSSDKA